MNGDEYVSKVCLSTENPKKGHKIRVACLRVYLRQVNIGGEKKFCDGCLNEVKQQFTNLNLCVGTSIRLSCLCKATWSFFQREKLD